MTDFFLHGFGSSGLLFRQEWEASEPLLASRGVFLDGFDLEPLSGDRRWFPFSGIESRLAASVAECAGRVESEIGERLRAVRRETGPIRLFGHSQGGMLALELACRGRLPIAAVHSFAAYLPAGDMPCASGRALDTIVYLHSSRGDPYIGRSQVESTVDRLRAAGIRDVRDRVAENLPHRFSPDWLRAAAFADASS